MRLAVLASMVVLVSPAAARAGSTDVACVDVNRPDCTLTEPSLDAALATSAHLVYLGAGPYTGNFASTDPVEISGGDGTVIQAADTSQPALKLTGGSVAVHNVRVQGDVDIGPSAITLDDDDLTHLVLNNSSVTARGLTVTGSVAIAGGTVQIGSSVIAGADPFTVAGSANVSTFYSAHVADPDVSSQHRVDVPADPRAVAGSDLQDAGDPAPLAVHEPFEDVTGVPRIANGRRDIGAYEVPLSAEPASPENVLANGGAEFGLSGWHGTFTVAGYGDAFLPTTEGGAAFGGGTAFFSGGDEATPELSQRIDVSRAAASIDHGQGQASLSGLLGGYGADPDSITVRAVFKDPENIDIGELKLGPVTPADRANDTTMLRRSAAGAIPARTRAIDVFLNGSRQAGTYTDAYADNLALELSVPGVPNGQGPDDPPVTNLKPFNGVAVLSPHPRVSRRGGTRLLVACASSTVGPCSGTLELDARVAGSASAVQIARRRGFTLRRGHSRRVTLRLLAKLRKPLLKRDTLRATVTAVARDGQGLQRRLRVPVRLNMPGAPRRRSGRGKSGTA